MEAINRTRVQPAVEQEAFQLPQPGLFADLDGGVGAVSLSNEFRDMAGCLQLSIISDWQRGLDEARRVALVRLFHDVTASLGSAGLPQKLSHFRQACNRIGIDCPADMAILLQQV